MKSLETRVMFTTLHLVCGRLGHTVRIFAGSARRKAVWNVSSALQPTPMCSSCVPCAKLNRETISTTEILDSPNWSTTTTRLHTTRTTQPTGGKLNLANELSSALCRSNDELERISRAERFVQEKRCHMLRLQFRKYVHVELYICDTPNAHV